MNHPDLAVGDLIINPNRPYEPPATIIGYDPVNKVIKYTMPNGSNPPITGFGPAHLFKIIEPAP